VESSKQTIKEEDIAITIAWNRVQAASKNLSLAEQEVRDAIDNLAKVKREHNARGRATEEVY
jgi:hypothetical protein